MKKSAKHNRGQRYSRAAMEANGSISVTQLAVTSSSTLFATFRKLKVIPAAAVTYSLPIIYSSSSTQHGHGEITESVAAYNRHSAVSLFSGLA